MGESEQLTQREELKNWLGRLSYILHRSDELHENLKGIREQYRYADYWQIWKLPQFFAHPPLEENSFSIAVQKHPRSTQFFSDKEKASSFKQTACRWFHLNYCSENLP